MDELCFYLTLVFLGAATLFGFSWAAIYLQIYQYILNIYGIYAGTALATITCVRYIFSGAMQLVNRPLWTALGTHWTCTLLGCLAVVLAPAT
jgi:DHA1 family multidrug resistance protein-like MFS transporter